MAIIVASGDIASKPARKAAGLFVTDLDGTLLRSDRTFSDADLASLQRIGERGIVRVVATGRSIFSYTRAAKVAAADLPVDYVVFSTGAGVAQNPSGRIVRSASLEPGEVRQAAAVLRSLRLDFMVQRPIPDTHVFGYAAASRANPDFEARIALYRPFAFPLDEDIDRFGPATQLLAIVPPAQASAALAAVRQKLPGLTVIQTTSPLDGRSTWIELFPSGVSKSLTAEWLAGELGVPRTQTLSVGNDFNDLDLLEWAHTRFVTANAPAELKERFPTVASNNQNGVTEAIERWLAVRGPRLPAPED
jgi:hydroxymethylpyrimidine pyrophosphatase-like HAD family hydrolase